jgi:hypothetical protein
MFHVEKIMFHAADGFSGELVDRLNMRARDFIHSIKLKGGTT